MPDEISDEDRDRLVKTKFSELFEENFERVFAERFDKRVAEMVEMNKGKRTASAPSGTTSEPAPQQQRKQRYSLLDKALGIG